MNLDQEIAYIEKQIERMQEELEMLKACREEQQEETNDTE